MVGLHRPHQKLTYTYDATTVLRLALRALAEGVSLNELCGKALTQA